MEITNPLKGTRCAICGSTGNSTEIYEANLKEEDFNGEVFSARRLPDRIHPRICRCKRCGLVRSDPMIDPSALAGLYGKSTFEYEQEVPALRRTYGKYLRKTAAQAGTRENLLEIGCGTGFMLEEALAQGYAEATGIEPSRDCKIKSKVADRIVTGVFEPGVFRDEAFDAICMFQVLDHMPDPGKTLRACRDMLRPGGALLILNHNVEAISAHLLGERSPIIDIEHTYLYSKKTLKTLLERAGLDLVEGGPVWNSCSLYYLVRLLPIHPKVKTAALGALKKTCAGKLQISAPLGNLYAIAKKGRTAGD